MLISIRKAGTGETLTTFRDVKHFQLCSTGATSNGRTIIMSKRYDNDDVFKYELLEGCFLCIYEQ